jgi:hypothetical protein
VRGKSFGAPKLLPRIGNWELGATQMLELRCQHLRRLGIGNWELRKCWSFAVNICVDWELGIEKINHQIPVQFSILHFQVLGKSFLAVNFFVMVYWSSSQGKAKLWTFTRLIIYSKKVFAKENFCWSS